jgi:hypothetical protein
MAVMVVMVRTVKMDAMVRLVSKDQEVIRVYLVRKDYKVK